MSIKHLVLPGGGAASVRLLGAIKKLHEHGIWNENNIESIHSVSAGALISVIIALKFDMQTIVDYMIGRPWDNVFQISLTNIFDVFAKKGFFGTETIVTFMKPFFNTKDISLDITMQEFYELTGVKLFFYTVEINTFKLVTVSNDTFPDLQVLKAVHMSAAYPVLLSPVTIDGKCYVDGGIITNYPISHCLKLYPNKDEVLGIGGSQKKQNTRSITQESTLLEYLLELIYKIVMNNYDRQVDFQNRENIPNYVEITIPPVTITNLQSAFSDIEERKKLLQEGEESAQWFVEKEKVYQEENEAETTTEGGSEKNSFDDVNEIEEIKNLKEIEKKEEVDLIKTENKPSDHDTTMYPWCFDMMPIV